jgi:hypothetical protein
MKSLLIALPLILSTGCASIVNGSSQTTNIDTHGKGKDGDVVCKVTNCKGSWMAVPNTSITVRRAGCDMQISCENEETGETGTATLVSEYKARFILPNILIDYGIISIPTDLITGAVYKYPETVCVDMDD